MTKEKTHTCEDCGRPTELLGWMFEVPEGEQWSLDAMVKVKRPWCSYHFIKHMFNLWPFTCTGQCQEAQRDRLGIELSTADSWVWLNLGVVLEPAVEEPEDSTASIPLKARAPSCPWCQSPMDLVELPDDSSDEVDL
ncbi:MAG: hypothetical protein HRU17_17245 [Polyangiaceae bacterium]|nr:hypothetical protein [Polyangiaceae bacterium]